MGTLNVLPPGILRTKLFEGLEQAEIKALVNKGEIKSFEPGETVVKEGDSGDTFFCVVSGSVEIVVAAPNTGEPVVLKSLAEGGIVGEMVLLKQNIRTASVIASKKSDLVCWHYSQCIDLFNSNPVLGYKLMRNLAFMVTQKLTDMNAKYKEKANV